MRARAFWITAPGQGEIREEILPPPAEGQALVRAEASGISRGTERLVLHGHVPESQWPVMRAPLQAGDFPFPVKYGYAAAGRLEDGQRVFCLHPHQDLFLAPKSMCIPIPDAVPSRRAVLAANMETALNINWDARPLAGERALVIGAGVVGLLAAWLLSRVPGMAVTLVDSDPARVAVARQLGLRFASPEDAPGEQELIIHASANPAGLRQALALAAFEARIVEASWYGDKEVCLPLGEAFHAKRLRLISSQVGAVAPAMRVRRSYAERMALALSLLAEPELDALCGPAIRFEELPARYADLLGPAAAGEVAPLCPVITY
ncbi:zinc-dependent alcohol dehydrogenase [Roseomonas marmotae]|uniref:Zinc-binding alcohol dehydrogenase n=1 Tax=Roseomonas marmotae TaxID=2768161 RepID=A0ABS3KBC6_9PROT|nr:zinc-binding alcohol dehydrogenase [Roseomonas marmotae]MBO1074773.1 zinc-binding alcohol dehydrogenase [Roseomonas marmotae]QTI80717.1 zinc-binding alcohol dehydrogenase [Roseomonas marmotae]